jgi:two-component system LytT family response regulator
MQVLIVEDEILLAKRLKKMLLEAEPDAVIAGMTQSVTETVEWLHTHPVPDLILMDIELADGQSFDIFPQAAVKSPVIFTTAYDEHAIRAFKVNSIDYLLKPIKETELKQALLKFKSLTGSRPAGPNLDELLASVKKLEQQQGYRERFLVRQGQKLISIDVADIAYIFSEKGMSFLCTRQNQKFILEYTLDELEKSLAPKKFFRANRGYILNNHCITAVHTWFNQKLKVDVKPEAGEPVIVSREKANAFKAWLGE